MNFPQGLKCTGDHVELQTAPGGADDVSLFFRRETGCLQKTETSKYAKNEPVRQVQFAQSLFSMVAWLDANGLTMG